MPPENISLPSVHQSRINPWPAFIITTGVIALVSAVALYTFHIISFVKPELAAKLHRYLVPTVMTLSTSGSFFIFDYIRTGIKGTNPLNLQPKRNLEGEVPNSCRSIEEMIDMTRDNTNKTMRACMNACSIHFNLNAQNLGVKTATNFINTFNSIIDNILSDIHQLGQLRATQDLLDVTTLSFVDAQQRHKLEQEAQNIRNDLEQNRRIPQLSDEQREAKLARLEVLERRLDHTQFLSPEQRALRQEKVELEELLAKDREIPELNDEQRVEKLARLQAIEELLCIPEDLDLLDKNNPLHQNKKENLEKFINSLATNLEDLLKAEVDTPIGKRNLFFILENPILETGAPLIKNKAEIARILNELLYKKLFDHEIIKLLKKNIPQIAELEKTTQEFVALFVHYLMDASGMYRSRMIHHVKRAIPKIAEQIRGIQGNNQEELIASIKKLFNPEKPVDNADPSALFLIKDAFERASVETHAIYLTTVIVLLLLAGAFAAIPHIKGEMTLLRKRMYVTSLVSGGIAFTTTMILLLQHYRWRDLHYTVTPAAAQEPEQPQPFPIPGVPEVRNEFVLLKDTMSRAFSRLFPVGPAFEQLQAEAGPALEQLQAQLDTLTSGLEEGNEQLATNPTLRTFLALDQHIWQKWYVDHAEEMRKKAQQAHEAYIREIMLPPPQQNAANRAKLFAEKTQAEAAAVAAATHRTGNVVQYFVPSRTEDMFFLKGIPAALSLGVQALKEVLDQKPKVQGYDVPYTYRQLLIGGWGLGNAIGLAIGRIKEPLIAELRTTLREHFAKFRTSVVHQKLLGLPLTQETLPAMMESIETIIPVIARSLLDVDRYKRGRIGLILTDERLDSMIAYLNALAPEWHQSNCQQNYEATDEARMAVTIGQIKRKLKILAAREEDARQKNIRAQNKARVAAQGSDPAKAAIKAESHLAKAESDLAKAARKAESARIAAENAKAATQARETAEQELEQALQLQQSRPQLLDKLREAQALPKHNLTFDEVLWLFDERNQNSPFTLFQEILSA